MRQSALRVVAVAGLMGTAPAHAEVRLQNAWLRPAAAGQPAAMVYVDIESTETLKLVGARSPVAKGAQLVIVDPPGAEGAGRVVGEIPVAAHQPRRLAYLGSHVRLVDIANDIAPGSRIPLELVFVDGKGARRTVSTEAEVRGITVR